MFSKPAGNPEFVVEREGVLKEQMKKIRGRGGVKPRSLCEKLSDLEVAWKLLKVL